MKATGLGRVLLMVGLLFSIADTQALESQANTVTQILQNARAKVSSGDIEAAAGLYHRAIQLDSNNQEAKDQLFKLLVHAQANTPDGSETEALEMIETNVKNPVNAPVNFSLTFLNNGALVAEDAAMSNGVLTVLQKLQSNDNDSALNLANNLMKQYPSHPVPYNLQGLAWQGLGDPNQARECFQQALALQENFHAARLNLAELELMLGEFAEAHQELDTVLKADNHNRRASLVKAKLHTIEGHPELSQVWYNKVSANL